MRQIQLSLWGMTIAALAVLSLAGGIAAELVAIKKTANEGVVALWTARNADLKQSAEASAANYRSKIVEQAAINAESRKKAEAELRAAEADIESANSAYARQQAEAEATKIEAELAKIKPEIQLLELEVVKCSRPCNRKHANKAHRWGEMDYFGCIATCAKNLVAPAIWGR